MAVPSFDVTAQGFPGQCDRAEDGLRGVEGRQQIVGMPENIHRGFLFQDLYCCRQSGST